MQVILLLKVSMFESDKDTDNLLRYFESLEKVNTLNFHVLSKRGF